MFAAPFGVVMRLRVTLRLVLAFKEHLPQRCALLVRSPVGHFLFKSGRVCVNDFIAFYSELKSVADKYSFHCTALCIDVQGLMFSLFTSGLLNASEHCRLPQVLQNVKCCQTTVYFISFHS